MKSKINRAQKDRVLEACRAAASIMNTTQFQILSDTSMVVRNNPEDIVEFVRYMKPFFNETAWEHTVVYSEFVKHLPPRSRSGTTLCSYDFYRALNKVHYFSAESALKRISSFGVLEQQKFSRTRVSLLGNKLDCSSSVQWFVSEINFHWKRFLAVGARLCVGSARSLYWKNYYAYSDDPIKAVAVNNTSFDIHIQGRDRENTRRQVELFLAYCDKKVIKTVHHISEFCYRVSINVNIDTPKLDEAPVAPQETKPTDSYQNTLVTTAANDPFYLETGFDMFRPKTNTVEDQFAEEIEKSINELTLIIDDHDRQIDELTATADKMRAQRGKLLRAHKALTE